MVENDQRNLDSGVFLVYSNQSITLEDQMESHEITANIFETEHKGVMEVENNEVRFRFESADKTRRYELAIDRAVFKEGLAEETEFEQDELGRVLNFGLQLVTLRFKQLDNGTQGWAATLAQRAVGEFTFREPTLKWLEEHL